jgi:hypothetical protein
MSGFLDFLHGAMGNTVTATPGADLGGITLPDGSQSGPIQATPTLTQHPGFLQGIDPTKLGQAGAGMRDDAQTQPGQDPMQQLMQMRAQRQQMLQQMLGGR